MSNNNFVFEIGRRVGIARVCSQLLVGNPPKPGEETALTPDRATTEGLPLQLDEPTL